MIEGSHVLTIVLMGLTIMLAIVITLLAYRNWTDPPYQPPPPIIFPSPKHWNYHDKVWVGVSADANEPRTLEDAKHAINKWNNDRPDWAFKMVKPGDDWVRKDYTE